MQAVKRRVLALSAEYARNARNVDSRYCGTASGETGPVERRLHRYDPVKGLVFRHFGEASEDVHKLVSALALAGSLRSGRSSAEDASVIRGTLAWFYERRWSMAAARRAARLILQRLANAVGKGAPTAGWRRDCKAGTIAKARRAACEPFWGRPLRPGRRIF